MKINNIYQGDCLEIMKNIQDKNIDMILCDLPYGTTACEWDIIIPFEPLWEQYKRIIKDNGAIVLTASQPFTSMLVMSNIKMFRYEWIWEKTRGVNIMNLNNMPLKLHENILVFYKKQPFFNNIRYKISDRFIDKRINVNDLNYKGNFMPKKITKRKKDDGTRSAQTILSINSEWGKNMHPTQKPVVLFEYLIKTYTNENDLVLDNCIGSGTTAIACIKLNRKFIGIEKEPKYVIIAKERIKKYNQQMKLNIF